MPAGAQINADDVDYIFGYFPDLSPAHLTYCALLNGHRFERPHNPRYLELGFGQGVSLNVHAASCGGAFWGNDFAPKHVAFARSVARAADTDLEILQDSFQELAQRNDLPMFDIIVLHGIWSWISNDDRAAIVDLVRRKLAPGGLLYVSYNGLASWAPLIPFRELIVAYGEADSTDRPLQEKLRDALTNVRGLIRDGALHFKRNPIVAERLEYLEKRDPAYLVHELFSHAWDPISFSDVADHMSEAGLSFLGSASPPENVKAFWMSEAAQRAVAAIENVSLREHVRDAFTNQDFRKDIFVKGRIPIGGQEQAEALLQWRFALSTAAASVPLTINNPQGLIALDQHRFVPVLQALASDSHAPKSVAQLAALMDASPRDLLDLLNILAGGVYVHVANPAGHEEIRQAHCDRLNRFVVENTISGGGVPVLASPVLRCGVKVSRNEQLFMNALSQGFDGAGDVANAAKAALERIEPAANADVQLAQLTQLAERFCTERAPILQSLGVRI